MAGRFTSPQLPAPSFELGPPPAAGTATCRPCHTATAHRRPRAVQALRAAAVPPAAMEEPYLDARGFIFCGPHRREVCYECCVDHLVSNDILREGPDADLDEINEMWVRRLQQHPAGRQASVWARFRSTCGIHRQR